MAITPRAISYWSRAIETPEPRRVRGRMSFAFAGACVYVGTLVLPGAGNGALVLIACAAILAFVLDRRTPRSDHELLLAVVSFALAFALSTLTGIDPARSLRLSVPLAPGMLLFLLVSGYFETGHVRGFYLALSATSLAMGAQLLWSAWHGSPGAGPVEWIEDTRTAVFVVPNDVAFFAAVLPLSLALIVDSPKSTRAWLAAVSSVTALAVVVVYQSRSALLTSLVAVTLWACRLQRRKGAALLGVAMFVTVATDALLGFPLVTRLAETWTTRVPIWLAALNMFRDAPLLGNGPRSFGLLFEEYFQTLTLPGWLPADPRFAPWAHSLYLETLAEQGIIGFGALVAVLSVGFAMTIGLRRAGPSETRVLAIGAETALVALCVAGVVELSFVRLWVVVLFFSVLGAIGALAATRREDGETCRGQ